MKVWGVKMKQLIGLILKEVLTDRGKMEVMFVRMLL